MNIYTTHAIMKFMETIVEIIDKHNIDEQVMEKAGAILKRGGLVAFPTETVYGLGANALDEEAAKKTYAAKGRPSDNPLIVHVANAEVLEVIAEQVSDKAKLLIDKFWPGPLTLIFNKTKYVPYGTTGGLETVAVRMPADEIALALIRAGGGFVSAPSANTSGRPSPTSASHVADDLAGKIDMILDGGSVDIGVESTILDMTAEPPMILRPGAITKEMLEEVIGEVAVDAALLSEETGEAPKAPGMKYRHYAPKAQLMIVEGETEEVVKAIKQISYEQTRLGYHVGIIATNETVDAYTTGIVKTIGARSNENSIAKNLYKVLREFDEEEVSYIYSEAFEEEGLGNAIMNRLEKAAGHHTIQAADITRLQKYRRILFISNSDNCRGPMAAELLRHEALLQEYQIGSRGMVVLFPEPANQKAEAIMRSQQMTLEAHEATPFDAEDLNEETLILTFEETQKWKIVSEYVQVRNVYTLNEYIEDERVVPSSHGQPLNVYGENFELLKQLVGKLATKLNEEAKNV